MNRIQRTYVGAFSSLAVTLTCMSASPLVLAQATDDAGTSGSRSSSRLDTITVYGNRLYEMPSSELTKGYSVDSVTVGSKAPSALRDVPQSVSVVTHDAIRDQNFHTLDEAARHIPGLSVSPNDAGRSSIFSRGYEYDQNQIDGLPAPMTSITGTVPDLAMFDRIEVLRGPSGLFSSTSELGGIVNLVPKRPTRDFQGLTTVGYGSWNQNYEQVDLSGPLNKAGSVRGRMVINRNHTNGYAKHNHNTSNDFYGILEADLDKDTRATLMYIHNSRDLVPNNGAPAKDSEGHLLNGHRNQLYGARWNDYSGSQNDWVAELSHHFSNGGYGHAGARYSNRNADYNYAFAGSIPDQNGEMSVRGNSADVSENSFSADASYSQPFSTFGNVSEYIVGADYKRYNTNTRTGSGILPQKTTIGDFLDYPYYDVLNYTGSGIRHRHTNETQDEYGLYGKLTFRPFSRLAVIAGARLSNYRVRAVTHGSPDSVDKRSGHGEFTPYGGLVFDVDSHHSLYASYSQVLVPQTDTNQNDQIIQPRKGEQYEAGIKGTYMDGKLNGHISGFRLTDKNRASAPANGDSSYSVARGKSRVEGVEVELTGAITPDWNIIAGYTYADTKTEKGDAVAYPQSRHTGTLWSTYHFDHGWADNLTVGGGMTAHSSIESGAGIKAGGYTTFDTMLAYDFTSRLRGQLNVNNIFDRKYHERVGQPFTFNMYGAPRSAVASLSYQL